MLSFKKFLEEEYLDAKSAPYEYFLGSKYELPFPTSKPMVERVVGELKRTRALHVTNLDGLQGLSRIENTAKQISVFTALRAKNEARKMATGVATSGGIMVDIEGQVVVLSTRDVWSTSDRDGTRWFDLMKFDGVTMSGDSLLEDYGKKLDKLYDNFMEEYQDSFTIDMALERMSEYWPANRHFQNHNDLSSAAADGDWKDFGEYLLDLKKGLDKWNILYQDKGTEKEEDFEKVKKAVNQWLYSWTKQLFDLAEDVFKEWKGEFITLFVEGDQKMYNEGIMTNFKVKKVWYDLKWFDAEDIKAVASSLSERPDPQPTWAENWPKVYQTWKRDVVGNRDRYYLGKDQEEFDGS